MEVLLKIATMKIVYDLGIAKIFQKYILTAQKIISKLIKVIT